MDVEAGHPQGLLQRGAQQFGGLEAGGVAQHRELVLADPAQDGLGREGGGQARAQGGQHQIGALVAQGLVQAAQAIDIGDDQLVHAVLGQALARLGDEALAVQQARQAVALGGRELDLGGGDARGAHPVLQPHAAPDAGFAAAHADAGDDLAAGFTNP